MPRTFERLTAEADAILTRSDEPVPAVDRPARAAPARARRGRPPRTSLGVVTGERASRSLSVAADVVLVGALRVAEWEARADKGLADEPDAAARRRDGPAGAARRWATPPTPTCCSCTIPSRGPTPRAAQEFALLVTTKLRTLLGTVGPEPTLEVDADLRPEGRNGPLVRSFDSYAEYYERWSSPWESQALLRARPVAGDDELGERFLRLIDPLRYPAGGVDAGGRARGAPDQGARRVRAAAARRRARPGTSSSAAAGISDVEWTAQLLQLQHAHEVPALRTTATLEALEAATEAGLLDADDARVLTEAWLLASRLRDANVLWSGRGGAHARRPAARPAGARRAGPRGRLPRRVRR